ncbi:phospholipase D-like domain-containing protein [Klebsiella pneumoniae]|uniref:phospholipase D n=1 Tax=Klebsiella quasipneumoniae subsp. similipneumoniae TaxID=1463164 RepID=A0AAE4SL37_9ENTR|nr:MULTISPECIES: phospholipase D-like domain-containing protein [Enterobacteriaceae]MCX8285594.1 phospholipase D-like domain-containing protein [Escherichia coli]MDI5882208.1 phospholipase D-like domain-containing protein [Enterobacter sp. EC-ML559]MCD5739059.1 phospholipase D-like domain-containing protein [Klebsiella pneumoniae]MCW9390514.1 phospholipase D-like domain-containing protein [Klebsiella quasipneumoniae]MCW9622262.1 phospholipase D-like domain-containing protein [Klebsiella michig
MSTDGTEMTLTNILVNAGVKVRLTDAYKIHHDKVIIIDRSTVETGSFNFTKAAEYSNSENALVLNDMPQVASVYLEHWQSRWETGRDWKSTY